MHISTNTGDQQHFIRQFLPLQPVDGTQQRLIGTVLLGCVPQRLTRQQTAQRMQQFASLAAKLDALSPLSVLGRGYAVARTEDGQILRAAQDVSVGEKIEVLLGQGSLNCTVDACNTGGYDDGKNV